MCRGIVSSQLSFKCQVILLSVSHFWAVLADLIPAPAHPTWHGKYVVSLLVTKIFFSLVVPGGCHSQGCHGYPLHSAQFV